MERGVGLIINIFQLETAKGKVLIQLETDKGGHVGDVLPVV